MSAPNVPLPKDKKAVDRAAVSEQPGVVQHEVTFPSGKKFNLVSEDDEEFNLALGDMITANRNRASVASFAEAGTFENPVRAQLDSLTRSTGLPISNDTDIDSVVTRFRGANLKASEKLKLLRQTFPGADLRVGRNADGSAEPLIRLVGSKEYIPFDSAILNKGEIGEALGHVFTAENVALGVGAIAAARLAPKAVITTAVERVVGEALAVERVAPVIAGRARGEILQNVGARAARGVLATTGAGGGAGLGSLVDEGIESATGLQGDPIDAILQEAEDAAVIGAASEGVVRFAMASGRGLLSKTLRDIYKLSEPSRQVAIDTAEALGLAPSPVWFHPVARIRFEQAAALGTKIGVRARKLQVDTIKAIEAYADNVGDVGELSVTDITRVHTDVEESLRKLVFSDVDIRSLGGNSFQKAAVLYSGLTDIRIGRQFVLAEEIGKRGDVKFDFSPLLGGEGKPGSLIQNIDRLRLRTESKLAIPINGKTTTTFNGITNQDLVNTLEQLVKLETPLSSNPTASSLRQLQAIRKSFVNLVDGGGLTSEESALATSVNSDLGAIMRNPSGNVPAGYKQQIGIAMTTAKRHNDILRSAWYKQIIATERPETVGLEMIVPENKDMLLNIRAMAKVAGPGMWQRIQNGYVERLIVNPGELQRAMNSPAGRQGLGLLISPGQQKMLLSYARTQKGFQSFAHNEMIRLGIDDGNAAIKLIDAGNALELRTIVGRLGGIKSKKAGALRAATIRRILDKSTIQSDLGVSVDTKAFRRGIERLQKSGAVAELFGPAEAQFLDNVKTMMEFLPSGISSGSKLIVAGIGAKAGLPLSPSSANADIALFKNYATGWYLTSGIAISSTRKAATREGIAEVSYIRRLNNIAVVALRNANKAASEIFPDAENDPVDLGSIPNKPRAEFVPGPQPIQNLPGLGGAASNAPQGPDRLGQFNQLF